MATIYALHVKLDLVLSDQPQRILRSGWDVWDYEPEHRLVWIDPDGVDHACEVPPVVLPMGYRPQTICGRDVTTTRLRLIETDDHPVPSCRSCFAARLAHEHAHFGAGLVDVPVRRMAVASLAVSALATMLLLAPNLDDFGIGPVPASLEMAHGPRSGDRADDPDLSDDDDL